MPVHVANLASRKPRATLSSDFTSQNNMDGGICRQGVVIRFMKLQLLDRDVLFWSGLASAHFARQSLELLEKT